jgi:hypothetical protein
VRRSLECPIPTTINVDSSWPKTIYQALGIDPDIEVHDRLNRPILDPFT